MAHIIGGRYRLDEELASGGFGTVWRAWDQVLHVAVALKQVRLDPSTTDAERARAVARAEAEARSAAKLRDHPNVVAVHDVAFDDGVPWLVMRLVQGRSLHAELAARGPLRPDEAGKIAVGVLEALAAAHDAGVVHRDVKPANIMLADDGTVLLTDFGIAKNHDDTFGTTRGVLLGSLPYMSPERLDGENPPAADLFALGVTLYEMTEGVSPFARATPTAVISAVARHDPHPPPHAGYLRDVIMALLDKDAAKRPAARAALAILARGGADPTAAAPASPSQPGAGAASRPEPPEPSPTPPRTLRITNAVGGPLARSLRIHLDDMVVDHVMPGFVSEVPLPAAASKIRILFVSNGGAKTSGVVAIDDTDNQPAHFTVRKARSGNYAFELIRDQVTR